MSCAENVDNIYQIEKFEDSIKLYLEVKEDKDNIRLHRVYSAAVSKYIKYRFPNKSQNHIKKNMI